ncbi:MAG: VWA domain-containing protein [Bacilli bacterium]|nr:VWA domain-containing protein [Bacilli bacterium]MBQ4254595.1 VWA domain-containing protein [Bacilli bacterium]
MNQSQVTRDVDIVFVIDATASMTPIMDSVKAGAKRFRTDLEAKIEELGGSIGRLRVRLITFRDFGVDANPLDASDFFELPDDQDIFEEKLNSITPSGGGDLPEDGFEALYTAFQSDFTQGNRDRQVIVLFTDADATPMGAHKDAAGYPADMGNISDLVDMWSCNVQGGPPSKLVKKTRRLVVFAPADTAYSELVTTMEQTHFEPVEPGKGLEGISFDVIVKIVASSI